MDKNTNKIVSVKNHKNKSDANTMDEAHQTFLNSKEVCRRSESSSFMNSCKENAATNCDEINMQIFNKFANQGRLSS